MIAALLLTLTIGQSIRPSFRMVDPPCTVEYPCDREVQAPTLKTDPKPAVTAPAAPELPEVVALKLQNIQLQATMAYKDLENSEAGRAYKAILDVLGQQIRALTAELETKYPGYTLDTTTLKLVPKVANKDGK